MGVAILLAVILAACVMALLLLQQLRDELELSNLSIRFLVDRDEGGEMEIGQLAVEIGGAPARVRLVGKTAAGRRAALEAIVATVTQNPERFTVEVQGDVAVVEAHNLVSEATVDPESGEVTLALPEPGDSSLTGTLSVSADGRIGEGVRHLDATLSLVAVAPDAVAIVFESVDGEAPVVEQPPVEQPAPAPQPEPDPAPAADEDQEG